MVVQAGTSPRSLDPRLSALLARLEAKGMAWASESYDGDVQAYGEIADELKELGIEEAGVWDDEPSEDQDRIVLVQSRRDIGTAGSLPAATRSVFAKTDNQRKLAQADTDERHLYVYLEDGGASAVLERVWPLPACPPDPEGVVDLLWVFSPSVSTYLFRVRPGTGAWEKFNSGSGQPA